VNLRSRTFQLVIKGSGTGLRVLCMRAGLLPDQEVAQPAAVAAHAAVADAPAGPRACGALVLGAALQPAQSSFETLRQRLSERACKTEDI